VELNAPPDGWRKPWDDQEMALARRAAGVGLFDQGQPVVRSWAEPALKSKANILAFSH
jgi:hypothetical protein